MTHFDRLVETETAVLKFYHDNNMVDQIVEMSSVVATHTINLTWKEFSIHEIKITVNEDGSITEDHDGDVMEFSDLVEYISYLHDLFEIEATDA